MNLRVTLNTGGWQNADGTLSLSSHGAHDVVRKVDGGVCGIFEIPMHETRQGMRVLCFQLGHPFHVEAHLQKKVREQQSFLEQIPAVQDLQSA